MIVAITVLGWLLLIGAVVGGIVARRRVWGFRSAPVVPDPTPPAGSIVLATMLQRGANMNVVPLLAHWHVRGVLEVHRSGPDAASVPGVSSSGPEWRFVVGDTSSLEPYEFALLSAFVPGPLERGAEHTLVREDIQGRQRITDAIVAAIAAQRAAFGPRQRRGVLIGIGLIAAATLGAVFTLFGAFSGGTTTGQAGTILGVIVGVGLVIALVRKATGPSDAERQYRQRLVNLREWVTTTQSPNAQLAGWAMIWNLPGAWRAAAPEALLGLLGRDRAFLRADFARRMGALGG